MFDLSKKKGFTLVELLAVIGLIGILSVMSVAGYTSYRKTALLDLTADDLAAQIYELRGDARYGDFGVDGGPKCFGMYFSNDGEGWNVNKFDAEYLGKKIWDGDMWEYSGCEIKNGEMKDVDLDETVKVEELFYKEGASEESFGLEEKVYLGFIPPDGDIVAGVEGYDEFDDGSLKLVMRYGEQDEAKYKRIIEIDLKSGAVSITKY